MNVPLHNQSHNLTQYLKVVGAEQTGMHPQLGHYLVVLKQIGQGRELFRVLAPGERPPEPTLKERVKKTFTGLVSIPVTAARNLRHEFRGPVQHVSPGHSFDSGYVLEFEVGSPDLVAAHWMQDPVRHLQDEVRRLCDAQARQLPWAQLKTDVLKDAARSSCQRIVEANVPHLKDFSQGRGLAITGLHMVLYLSNTDAQPDAETAAVERDKSLAASKLEREKTQKDVQHELNKLDAVHKGEIADLELPQRLRTAGVESAIEALKNVAGNTTRGEDLVRTLREINTLVPGRQPGVSVGFGGGPGAAAGPAMIGAPERYMLEAAPDNPFLASITGVVQLVDSLPGDAAAKRELLADLLHLIAEASRGPNADADLGIGFERSAKDKISDWQGISASDWRNLDQASSFEHVKERLR